MEKVHNRYVSAVKRTPNYEEGLLDLVSLGAFEKLERDFYIPCDLCLLRSNEWKGVKLFAKMSQWVNKPCYVSLVKNGRFRMNWMDFH